MPDPVIHVAHVLWHSEHVLGEEAVKNLPLLHEVHLVLPTVVHVLHVESHVGHVFATEFS